MARAKTDRKILSSPRRATFTLAAGQVFWLPEALRSRPSRANAQWREAINPVTAAGPRRSHTGFPILPFGHPTNIQFPELLY